MTQAAHEEQVVPSGRSLMRRGNTPQPASYIRGTATPGIALPMTPTPLTERGVETMANNQKIDKELFQNKFSILV